LAKYLLYDFLLRYGGEKKKSQYIIGGEFLDVLSEILSFQEGFCCMKSVKGNLEYGLRVWDSLSYKAKEFNYVP